MNESLFHLSFCEPRPYGDLHGSQGSQQTRVSRVCLVEHDLLKQDCRTVSHGVGPFSFRTSINGLEARGRSEGQLYVGMTQGRKVSPSRAENDYFQSARHMCHQWRLAIVKA